MKPAGKDHRIETCRRRQKCTKTENGKECPHYHHPLLPKSIAVNIAVASLSNPHDTLLPVITCTIYGQNGFQKQVNTLLDSGAQVSLIREETATTLGLKGKDTAVTITKVGGEEETIKTKVYKVSVSSPDNTRMLSIKASVSRALVKKCQQYSSNQSPSFWDWRTRGLVEAMVLLIY